MPLDTPIGSHLRAAVEASRTGSPKHRTTYVAPAYEAHFPHDYDSSGRCRVPGCPVYDRTEDDDRMEVWD